MPRSRKPIELHPATGTFRPHRHALRAAAPKSDLPIGKPLGYMAPAEAAAWREFVLNAPEGVLSAGDRWILEMTARLMNKSRHGGLVATELGHLRACLTELGATPASLGQGAGGTACRGATGLAMGRAGAGTELGLGAKTFIAVAVNLNVGPRWPDNGNGVGVSDQQGLYTLAEASELTGLSTEALRLRIKRGKLAAERGNDGHPRVRITDAERADFARLLARRKSTLTRQSPTLTRQAANNDNATNVLEVAAAALHERAARAEAERNAARAEAAAERERADKAEAEREAARAEAAAERTRAAQAEHEREAAKVAAASAEGRAEGLRLALAEARRPFWRRWIG